MKVIEENDDLITYETNYGKITLCKNELYIGTTFSRMEYWDENNLIALIKYIPKDKNILEIGGHCGTSTIFYAKLINDNCKVYVYEPQKKMFDLLVRNIKQNNLENKIIPFNEGVFCYTGDAFMNDIDMDGCGRTLQEADEKKLGCNYGGISLGNKGEKIHVTKVDDMNIDNIGFIHCDAQGSENYIFYGGKNTITKFKPILYYEDNTHIGKYLIDQVNRTYFFFETESKFNISTFCEKNLGYSEIISNFNGSKNDSLLLP